MAVPSNRQEFKDYVMRGLGYPQIAIEVTEEQLDDRVDEALSFYWDYHFDGAEKVYYKHAIQTENRPDRVYGLKVSAGGSGYANGEAVSFTGGGGSGAAGVLVTDANGAITSVTMSNNGVSYATAPSVSISTSSGTGASVEAELGGFIVLPENVHGVVRLFSYADALASGNMFSIRYQIALNDLYSLISVSLVPFYSTFQHLALMEEILVGKQPIRYSRHRDRLYLDMDWQKLEDGEYVLVEAYEVIDPSVYTDTWKDRWLYKYCSALVKRQWGNHLKKYGGMQLLGNVVFNGQQIYDEADAEIKKLEEEMIMDYSIPCQDFIG